MLAVIEPGSVSGTVTAPPSKSYTQRACAAALLHPGKTIIHNTGKSADEQAAIRIIRQAGCELVIRPGILDVFSTGTATGCNDYDCGESGLATRMFLPVLAGSASTVSISGRGSLAGRHLGPINEIMSQLGVDMPGYNGCIPFVMHGGLVPGDVRMSAATSSQLLTGLLFALSAKTTQKVSIYVEKLSSKPYIDMTLDILARSGRPVQNIGYREFVIDPAKYDIPDTLILDVEGDWSSAAFFLVAGAIAGSVTVKNLHTSSKQADKAILDVFGLCGALHKWTENGITVQRSALNAFEFDASDCPDLFPILAVLAACCNGESAITGLNRLFHKESNRVESIGEMLLRFDVPFTMEENALYVTGGPSLGGYARIDSYHDHRIEMAAAVGALRTRGPVHISGAGSNTKSYPDFWKDLMSCGVNFRLD